MKLFYRNTKTKIGLFADEEVFVDEEIPVVKCTDCHCLIDKEDAQDAGMGEHYCGKCKKPYDKKYIIGSMMYGETPNYMYTKSMEVDINGEPIGYKKVK